MTSPRLAVATDAGRMYARTPGGEPLVPSITNVLGVYDKELAWWDASRAVKACITHAHRIVRMRDDERPPRGSSRDTWGAYWQSMNAMEDWLAEEAERDRTERARLGDLVHDYAEQVALAQLGQVSSEQVTAARARASAPLDQGGGAGPMCDSFDQFWADYRPRVLQPEATVWNHTVGYAGTTDLICELVVGGRPTTCVLDYKGKRGLFKKDGSRKAKDLHEETGMQLAAAVHAEEVWVPPHEATGQDAAWQPFPYRIEVALGVGLAPDGYAVRQYNLADPTIWRTFTGLCQAWQFRRAGRGTVSDLLTGPDSITLPGTGRA